MKLSDKEINKIYLDIKFSTGYDLVKKVVRVIEDIYLKKLQEQEDDFLAFLALITKVDKDNLNKKDSEIKLLKMQLEAKS